jgi:glycosyltransferase involved in cell wall biosynthesis
MQADVKMKSVLILQGDISEYRVPVFEALAETYNVTVLHSGNLLSGQSRTFSELCVPKRKFASFFLQSISQIRRISAQYDVVISMFDLRWPAYILPFIGPRKKIKWILWGHRYSNNRLANLARDLIMARADRLLMYANEDVDCMIKRGIKSSKIAIAPNTIFIPNHADTSSYKKNSFLYVGRLQPRKRLDLLINSFSRIKHDVVLDIIGDGEIKAELQQMVTACGLEHRVTFHGSVQDPVILADFFSRAYAYISPGPVGLGVLHSFAYGVPVVTLRHERHGPEFSNLKHKQNALIVEKDDDLLDSLQWVLNQPQTVAELGRNAYAHYSRHRTLEIMVDGFKSAIDA